jgi:anhydro-N-acetylmuramic acid kinase
VKKYKVIGLMSGTSLDGLDIAYCSFEKNRSWTYTIIKAETLPYTSKWKAKLTASYKKKPGEISDINFEFGKFIGKEVVKFIKANKIFPDLISSHGHTVFHQPDQGITVQIGDGKTISYLCKLPVVCDFRSGDMALGGQGAPLVPIADKLLFSEYKYCLNLGGFANISFDDLKGKRIAFDICPVNMILNALANKLGKGFDKGGKIASKGKVDSVLLKKLNRLAFYRSTPPKSLGREWVEKKFFPILDGHRASVQDKARTVCEHIAVQIASIVNTKESSRHKRILVTGGGAYNQFLIKRISSLSKPKVILPDDQTIQFKEAMAFAFLGVLRMRNEINILKSVTGAIQDSSGGTICSD